MKKEIAERVVIGADFEFASGEGSRRSVDRIVELVDELADTGVVFKINADLRSCGYILIDHLKDKGVKICADLKLNDIPQTLERDAKLLAPHKPDFVTVMASAGVDGMRAVQDNLPDTEVWGVTVLTSLDESMCSAVYGSDPKRTVLKLALLARDAGLKGLILSPKEATLLTMSDEFRSMTLNSPGIRYPWSETGDQKRFATAGDAIRAGIDRVVVGRPILNAKADGIEGHPQSRREALEWIQNDIEQTLAEKTTK